MLIATPIVLDMINDTKEKSNQRSLELYAKAVENAVATYQLKSEGVKEELTLSDIESYVEYDGPVSCERVEIYEDGNIYLGQCKFNEVLREEYIYGNPKLTTYIEDLYKPNTSVVSNNITYNMDTKNGLMNDRLGGITENLNDGNIRYYGSIPNNYVDIGDRDADGNITLWRIIGLFKNTEKSDGTKENLIKIIRSDSLGNYIWDNKTNGLGSSVSNYGSNDWSDARLMKLLNPGYEESDDAYSYEGSLYWNRKSGTCYSGSFNDTSNCDFTSSGLNDIVREKIETVSWNLHKHGYASIYSNDIYLNNIENKWIGKIALLHPSDYGYAVDLKKCNNNKLYSYSTDNCKLTNWLYNNLNQWLITPVDGSHTSLVWQISSGGSVVGYNGDNSRVLHSRSVRPTLYLKNNLVVKSGTGTSDDPYIIE